MEQWHAIYRAAVLECDPKKLQEYVQAAEQAIEQRSASLKSQISSEERLAMQDALSNLRVLRRERKDFSSESSAPI
jgi:BMFP domain-containing protein YqiC